MHPTSAICLRWHQARRVGSHGLEHGARSQSGLIAQDIRRASLMLSHTSQPALTDHVCRTTCRLRGQPAPLCPSFPLRPFAPRSSDILDARCGRLVCAAYSGSQGDGWGFLLFAIALIIGFFTFLGCFYTVDAGSVALTETFGALPAEPMCMMHAFPEQCRGPSQGLIHLRALVMQ